MGKTTKIVLGIAAAVVVVIGAGLAYFFSSDAKEKPTVDNVKVESDEGKKAAADTNVDTLDGTWTLTSDSIVQYRVDEVLQGASVTATGSTKSVTGSLTAEGTTVTAASFEVQVATFTSDKSQRDNKFKGEIMDTATHPTATFELTEPIDLGSVPADGVKTTATATGDLTLKGTTKPIQLELTIERQGALFKVAGSYTVVFADWGIDDPSFGGFVETKDRGDLEVALLFARN